MSLRLKSVVSRFALTVVLSTAAASADPAPHRPEPVAAPNTNVAVAPLARTVRPAAIAPAEHDEAHAAPQAAHAPIALRATPAAVHAPAVGRSSLPPPSALHATLNAPLATEFPRLAPLLKDPDAFFATMSDRFVKQKLLTPSDGYRFDYSEIGMPLVKDMRATLKTRIDELSAGKIARSPEERQVAIQHLTALANEADGYLKTGAVSYRNLIEYCHFYTRAVGQFDTEAYPKLKRMFLKVDERIEGFKKRSPEQEYEDYQARRFSLFQHDTKTSSKGFAAAEQSFEHAVFDPAGLKTLLVPTNDALTEHLLMRLGSRENINMVGVADKPMLADGFLRPAGMFWLHDLRHQSAKFQKKTAYVENHALSTEKTHALNDLMDGFYVDLKKEMAAVEDPTLREALRMLTFNFYFDRGHPMVPSTFLEHKSDYITLSLYVGERIGGQEVKFKAPVRNLGRAEEWLRNFWEARKSVESDFLSH